MSTHHLNRHALAMRIHLANDNERLREALKLIAEMSETSTSALTLQDVARIARTALVVASGPNPALAIGT
jgi:hypothetical protein